LNVSDKLSEETSSEEELELGINLAFNTLKDFEPESIVRQVPELNKLLELREALVALKGPLGNVPAFRKEIQSVLDDETKKNQLMSELDITSN